nr:hypothetical protein [Tanacetum cinerariifolium]
MGGTLTQTRSKRVLEQPNEPPLLEGYTSGSKEGRMEHTFELMDTVPPTPYDSPLTGGYTPRIDEGRLKLLELINICTTLSNRVTTLENELSSTTNIYLKAFITLTKRVKKLQTQLKQKRSRAVIHSSNEEEPSLDIKDSSKQERMIREIDKDKNVKLVSEKGKIHETAEPLKDEGKDIIAFSKAEKQKLDEQPNEEVEAQVDSDQEVKVMKLYMRIVPNEEIAIDAIPLATKSPVIVEYKIVKEGKISTYHIIRADESTKRYTSMIKLLENIDKKDLETLWKLVKDKHGNTRLEENYERVL